jgi:signal transduction histidine kinase
LRGVNRGLSLSEKLRRFERIDYDDVEEDVDLNEIIDLTMREYSSYIEQSKISIDRKRNGSAMIKGSPQLFEIMFTNLLDNSIDAINASKSGEREIAIAVKRKNDAMLEVIWQDSGIGIDKDKFEKIFQPFYTGKPKTGTGLGLSMVRNIVSKYNGTIEVDSIRDKYTKFRFTFDLA